jgi:hypothetical protein
VRAYRILAALGCVALLGNLGWGEMGSNYILLGFVCPTFLPFSAFHFYSFFSHLSINIPRDFSFYLCCMFVGKLCCCLFDVSGLLRITVW